MSKAFCMSLDGSLPLVPLDDKLVDGNTNPRGPPLNTRRSRSRPLMRTPAPPFNFPKTFSDITNRNQQGKSPSAKCTGTNLQELRNSQKRVHMCRFLASEGQRQSVSDCGQKYTSLTTTLTHPHLVQFLVGRETREPFLNDERRYAF